MSDHLSPASSVLEDDVVVEKPSLPERRMREAYPFIDLTYDGLNLPPLSADEEKIYTLGLDARDILGSRDVPQGLSEQCTQLLQQGKNSVLASVDTLVHDYILEKAQALGLSGDLMAKLSRVITIKQWSGVSEGSPEKFVLQDLVARSNRIKTSVIRTWIALRHADTRQNAVDQGLSYDASLDAQRGNFNFVERMEYIYVPFAMAALDRLYIRLSLVPPLLSNDERIKRGYTRQWAVTQQRDGDVVEVPMHEAFPQETKAALDAYSHLIMRLRENTDPALADLVDRKVAYYEAVMQGYATSDNAVWKKADALLAGQLRTGSDTIHIHPIETGYMKDGVVRAPGGGLRMPDVREGAAQDESRRLKASMVASLSSFEGLRALPAVQKSLPLLAKSNATVRHFFGSGMEMDLKPAGQILPNDFEERVVGGVDSSLDMGALRSREPMKKECFVALFGEDAYKALGLPVNDVTKLGDIASHELGHAVGLMDSTYERLPRSFVEGYVEEWKASVGGALSDMYVPYLQGERSIDDLSRWVADHVAEASRYMMGRHRSSAVPYVREIMMLMGLAERIGILEERQDTAGESPWNISLTPEKVEAFFAQLLRQYQELMYVYGEGDLADLEAFVAKYLQLTPFLAYAEQKLIVPSATATVDELCKTPAALSREAAERAATHEADARAVPDIADHTAERVTSAVV